MNPTRRQSAVHFLGFGVLAGLVGVGGMAAAGPAEDDDGPANVFISPCGQPFRARVGADYPVADWFRQADKNKDGRIDHGEFVADAAAFFSVLDLNADGVLDRFEISVYERRICPEVLGARVKVGLGGEGRVLKWLAQAGRYEQPIDPNGDAPMAPASPKGLDESGVGASPYSLFQEPEPVAAADLDLQGVVPRKNFLRLADMHFVALDEEKLGYLTLATLPKTSVQQTLEKSRPRRRKS